MSLLSQRGNRMSSALQDFDAVLLSHMYPPKHPPHCSLSQQGFDSFQLEQPFLRQDLQVLSFGCIERFASAGTSYLRLSRIPGASAHSHTWENIPFGARMPGILPMRSIFFASSSASLYLCLAARPDRVDDGPWNGFNAGGGPRRDVLRTSGPGPCRSPRRPFLPGRRRRPAAWPRRPRRRST